MTGFLAVFRRELWSVWVTPLAWVLLVSFLLIQGTSFYITVNHFAMLPEGALESGPLQAYFGQSLFLPVSLVLLCPALTMRLFAEERKSGTIEPLLTAPVTPAAVVLGKYLATLVTYLALWLPTLLYVLILRNTGELDWQVVAASYLGILGIGGGYLAVGTFMSALTKSQLVALMLSFGALFGTFVLGIGEYVFEPGPLRDLCAHVSVMSQVDELSRGIVDLRRLVFDLTLLVLPLFLATRVVDSWRWD
jgi:ABC-2 type transport system permease protein